MATGRAARAWAGALAGLVFLTGCAHSHGNATGAGHASGSIPARPALLVLGGADTEGEALPDRLRTAWPYLVYREAMPRDAEMVNGAFEHATAAEALGEQAPLDRELAPRFVAMWIGVDDLRARTPVRTFERSLTELIHIVKADGAQHVLVADIPDAYGNAAATYDAAIRATVRSTGAVLVELEPVAVHFVEADHLPPVADTATHREIATRFERALRSTP